MDQTFAMADLAGSSRLWNRHPEQMAAALARHDDLAQRALEGRGEIFKHTGDGFIAVFDEPVDAVRAMAAYQQQLSEQHDDGAVALRSRACIHRGAAQPRAGDWFGPAVNHLARITDLVAPTHVVVSDTVAASIDDALLALDPLGAFSVRDIPDPVPLYGVRIPSSVGPALKMAAGQGLPRFHSPLIGREDELAAVVEILGREQLVTILGFGGMGKTRLAVEAATAWVEAHGAAAHFADLASSRDPMATMADAIGVPSGAIGPGGAIHDAVARHVGDRAVLLVVDNCEHVIDTVARGCAELMSAVPRMRLLATSREPLEIDGEAVFPLGPLSEGAALDLLRRRVQRAGAAEVPEEAASRLCAQVDHLPLGIELVAARLLQFDPEALSGALDDDLGELRTRRRSRRGADATGGRHSTMRALVAWSFDLLDADEQTLLLRLAQLPAPFTSSTARHLGAGLPPDLLHELVAKSLVGSDRASKLRILEPIRRFCEERLAEDPDATAAAADALIGWATAHTQGRSDSDAPVFDPEWARQLADLAPNLRAAHATARAADRPADEAQILLGLWPMLLDGRARLWFGPLVDDALERATDPVVRHDLLLMALHDSLTNPADAEREAHLTAVLAEVDPAGTSTAAAVARLNGSLKQAVVHRVFEMDMAPLRAMLAEEIERARASGRLLHEGIAEMCLAYSHLLVGDLPAAVTGAEEAAASLRAVHFDAVVALTDATSAMSRGLQADADLASALAISATAVLLGESAPWETSVLTVHATLLARAGRVDEAREMTVRTIHLAQTLDAPAMYFDAAIALTALRMATASREDALAALELVGVGRTPLTIFLLLELASELGLELGSDRFLDALDPQATARRGAAVAELLRAALPALEA